MRFVKICKAKAIIFLWAQITLHLPCSVKPCEILKVKNMLVKYVYYVTECTAYDLILRKGNSNHHLETEYILAHNIMKLVVKGNILNVSVIYIVYSFNDHATAKNKTDSQREIFY
jgi:hypothetical protein